MIKNNSIHTIANDLGVSPTTISFIINGKARENRISERLVERVEAYLKKIGYQPNLLAQSLRTGKTNVIGMLVEDISDPFFSAVARAVEIELEKSGYSLFLMSSSNKSPNAISILEILSLHGVDGFIIAPVPGLEPQIEKLLLLKKPLVLFDRYFNYIQTCNVISDNRGGVFMGILELYNNSFKNIAFITIESDQIQMQERYNGYLEALKHLKQGYEIVLHIPFAKTHMEMLLIIKNFLQKNRQIDGILFSTNYLAIAGLHALKELKLKVGRDIGIISFDDNFHFGFINPPVTAVSQPITDIADTVVSNLLSALKNNQKCTPKTIMLPTKIIKRASSLKTI
ncbi:LacI family DNA-binding transcriptional regulator [Arachidicoccus terrestris]|uniref:LacI family DNA-binding transcriptional regulator n=1 Tax=Arachidicoccus terrestris TaxID=2875539 RepID=UPI001CC6DD82|nr:LacI family DNA-binding transcriptional regulator [Arachidicoccus terrestris]UAY56039.1 LacI family transcriptional regulator [Arachidicoccus terrestris]